MVEWKHITGTGLGTYESYHTSCKENAITVLKLREDKAYTYVWSRYGIVEAEITFQAENWDEAKAYALNGVKKKLDEKAKFWRDQKTGFLNWVEN